MATWGVTYTIRDRKGATATLRFNLPYQALSDAQGWAEDMATYLDAVITGVVQGVNLQANISLPVGLKTVPGDDSDVEAGARFDWQTAGGFRTSNRVPTFDEQKITVGGTSVDLTDLDVADFVQMVTAAIELPGNYAISPCDGRGDDIVALTTATEDFRPR
jgi:hypothetical protein